MTKYFKARVLIQNVVEVNVAAETEQAAHQMAMEAARQQSMRGGSVCKVELAPDGETEFSVGARISHRMFGTGEIVDLTRMTGTSNEFGFRATIKFDRGDTKDIALPLPRETLSLLSV